MFSQVESAGMHVTLPVWCFGTCKLWKLNSVDLVSMRISQKVSGWNTMDRTFWANKLKSPNRIRTAMMGHNDFPPYHSLHHMITHYFIWGYNGCQIPAKTRQSRGFGWLACELSADMEAYYWHCTCPCIPQFNSMTLTTQALTPCFDRHRIHAPSEGPIP